MSFNEPVSAIAGDAVVQFLPRRLEEKFSFDEFKKNAPLLCRDLFEAEAKKNLDEVKLLCSQRKWTECAEASEWLDSTPCGGDFHRSTARILDQIDTHG